MENSEIRLLLLDFDGTLADTRRANTLSYVAALGEAGYTLTEEEYAANYFGMRCNEFLTRFGIAGRGLRNGLPFRRNGPRSAAGPCRRHSLGRRRGASETRSGLFSGGHAPRRLHAARDADLRGFRNRHRGGTPQRSVLFRGEIVDLNLGDNPIPTRCRGR